MSPLLTCSVVLGRPCSYSRCKHLVCLSNYCGVLHEGIGGGRSDPDAAAYSTPLRALVVSTTTISSAGARRCVP